MAIGKNIKKLGLKLAQRTNFFQITGNFAHKNFLVVLNYHRVDYATAKPQLDPSLISTTPDEFERQMCLLRDKFSPVSVEEVLAVLSGKGSLPRRAVLVTVDDGYRDYADYIFPIASQFGVSPLLFLTTGYVDAGIFWWDKLYQAIFHSENESLESPYGNFEIATVEQRLTALRALRAKIKATERFDDAMRKLDVIYERLPEKKQIELSESPTLDWGDLRSLTKKGAEIAAHTHTHPLLTRIPFTQACQEISLSRSVIEKELGQSLPVFAFTDGQPQFFSNELMSFLKNENIQLGFTTIDQSAVLTKENALAYPRVGVYQRLSLDAFAYRLTPLYKALR